MPATARRVAPRLEPLEGREVPATFIVTNTDDSGPGSLRQALLDANAAPNPYTESDTVTFAIGTGLQTIRPASPLPAVTDAVTIDGWGQGGAGYNGPPLVELDGSDAGPEADGLTVTGPAVTVRGLVVNRFGGTGVLVTGSEAGQATVTGCYIGTTADGTAAAGNGGAGVWVTGGAWNANVGLNGNGFYRGYGTGGNVISGNRYGVVVGSGTGTTSGTFIGGNFIGTNRAGTAALGNTAGGVYVGLGAAFTRVGFISTGADQPGFPNLISGNGGNGVTVAGSGDETTAIGGNRIGTDAAGLSALGNGGHGVAVTGGSGTVIGAYRSGSGPSTIVHSGNYFVPVTRHYYGNLISANGRHGIFTTGAETERTVAVANLIGIADDGKTPLGNGGDGIRVESARGRIGYYNTTKPNAPNFPDTGAPWFGNVVGGNAGAGIRVTGAAAVGNRVEGNFVGVASVDGTAIGNAGPGISVEGGAVGTGVGKLDNPAERANIVAFNAGGIRVTGAATDRTPIRSNRVHSNSGLGIDLGGDGRTPNDPLDADAGPNGLQNFPEVSARTGGPTTRVGGTLRSTANATFALDFYANPAGTAQGARYLGSLTVTTDAAGRAVFDLTLAAATAAGEVVTATATDAAGNTSEFSAPAARADLVVNRGQLQRSIIRHLDVTLDSAATATALTDLSRLRLVRRDLQGNNPTNVPLAAWMVSASGATLRFSFGSQGIGGARNSAASDGHYTLELDLDGDGARETARSFCRLLGDTDNDGEVTQTDADRVAAGIGKAFAPDLDVNGDGVVNSTDRLLVLRHRNRALAAGLPLDG